MKTFEVRLIVASDAQRLAALNTQLGYPCDALEALERIQKFAHLNNHAVLIAADENGVAQAYIHLEERYLSERGAILQVAALVVDAQCRGKGLGKLLMGYAEKHAKEKGFQTILLNSGISRTEAHLFYESLGYKRTGQSFKFERQI